MRWLRLLLLGPLLVLAVPATAQAHESIFTLKYVDGENIVVASFNVHEFTAGQPVTFNLRVYTIGGVPVAYKNVQATVQEHGDVVVEETMAASAYNDVDWVYAFPEAGDFDLALSFTDGAAPFARATFPIDVANGPHGGDTHGDDSVSSQILSWPTGVAFLLGIGLTLLVGRLLMRRAGGPVPTDAAPATATAEPPAMTEVS